MRLRALIGAGAIAITTLVTVVPAEAAPKPKPPKLLVDSVGTYTVDATGAAVVTGDAEFVPGTRDALPGTLTAVLSPADGTLPEPETCEPATATFTVEGDKRVGLTLAGDGEVCGVFPQTPFIVTHVFTGRYEVVDAERRPLVGTDGFFEVRLGLGNVGTAFAVDT